MAFESSIVIHAPVEKVFAIYTNVSGWPDWDPDVESSQLDGTFAPGTRGSLKPKQGPNTKVQLIEVTQNQSFTVECKLPLCKMHFIHELKPVDQSTEVTNKLIFTGLLSPIFSRVMGKEINATLPASLAGLKTYAENS